MKRTTLNRFSLETKRMDLAFTPEEQKFRGKTSAPGYTTTPLQDIAHKVH